MHSHRSHFCLLNLYLYPVFLPNGNPMWLKVLFFYSYINKSLTRRLEEGLALCSQFVGFPRYLTGCCMEQVVGLDRAQF